MPKLTKILVLAFLSTVTSVTGLVAQTSSEIPKFTLTLRADNSVVTLGSDIEIGITITNISEDTLTLVFSRENNVESGYQYEVRDEQGAMASKVAEHNPPMGGVGSSTRGILKPGDSIGSGTQISDVYQFDRPGKYTIQVSRKEPGMPLVQSNIITVTVLPAPPPPAQ